MPGGGQRADVRDIRLNESCREMRHESSRSGLVAGMEHVKADVETRAIIAVVLIRTEEYRRIGLNIRFRRWSNVVESRERLRESSLGIIQTKKRGALIERR